MMLSSGTAELSRFGFHGAWEKENLVEKNHKAQITKYLYLHIPQKIVQVFFIFFSL